VSPARHHHALPEGYLLHWYEIDSILGQGGFGITYLARDTNLDQLVAIKEFLPSDLAVRTRDSDVHPLSGEHTDTYGWGLNRFLTEARTLAKFRHPNIVRVMSVFEANNTAYMVMEYERGESFENMLKFKQVSGEQTLKSILLALLDGLELVHDAGFIHRDIKPSNVYLREDGVPVLLDFGSARLALGVETRTLTSLVSPGYAPFEQYNATRESDKQGPWTDIYALGATMYRSVTGQGPIDAAARANLLLDEQRDPFEPCSQMSLPDYSQAFLHAIDRALAFPPGERPQSVGAWRQLVVAGAVDAEAATLAVDGTGAPRELVDITLDAGTPPEPAPDADTGTRTVPMAELEAATATTPPAASTGRGWFIATSVVVVAGVAMAAWLSLAPSNRGVTDDSRQTASAPAPVAAPAPDTTPVPGLPSEPEPTPIPAPAPVAEAAPAPVAEAAPTPPSEPVQTPPEQKPTIAEAIAAAAAERRAAQEAQAPIAPAPAPEPPAKVVAAPTAPAPQTAPEKTTPEKKAPEKQAPEKIAKAAPAPAKKSAKTQPPAKKSTTKKSTTTTTAKKPAKPRTREEKVTVLLDSAAENMRADRLTKPKKKNALSDYLTVLAIDKDNDAAHLGVESIVERYVAMSGEATGAGQFDKASGYLKQARFVLDAMKLRKWSSDRYNALFQEYREAGRALAAAR
jgi:serine/threonine protein kinase